MSDEGRVRKRVPKSCQRCYRRKQRCVGYPTCSNCELAKQPCARSEVVSSWHHAMSKGALARRIEFLEKQLSAAAAAAASASHKPPPYTPPSHHASPSSRGGADNGPGDEGVLNLSVEEEEEEEDIHNQQGERSAFMGPSSGLAVVENLSHVLHDVFRTRSIPVHGSYYHQPPDQRVAGDDERCTTRAPPPDEADGLKLLRAYFGNTHTRLTFLDRAAILRFHAGRNSIVGPTMQDRLGRFKLFAVYGIGATILRMTEPYSGTSPKSFLAEACRWKPPFAEMHPLDRVEALMLLVVFHLRTSSTVRVWHMLGQAMRICTGYGLHCKSQYRGLRPCEAERRLRLFWSVYLLERCFCWAAGRPFSIAEAEIDAELPADVAEDGPANDPVDHLLYNPMSPDEPFQGHGLRRFIVCIKLQRLVSSFKNRVYRVGHDASTLVPEIAPFMSALEAYKDGLPVLSASDGEFVQMHWNNCVRVLLQPFVSVLSPSDPWIQACMSASGRMCQSFRKLRQRGFGYSFLLTNSMFVAGMTMCLCLLRSPHLWTTTTSNDLRACSSAMSVMAEHNASLKKYRDTLEVTIDRTMEFVNQSVVLPPTMFVPEDVSKSRQIYRDPPSGYGQQDASIDWVNLDVSGLLDMGCWQSTAREPATLESLGDIFLEDMWSSDYV
ncbi:hypothetical protein FE257_003536 [Aspergillus nanangensis]|uniref:Xylanolytic transcriptional activator regulatory domain-containing protein n=1 Tax=Aspergillus nanangensis TaxID=2582783 RepID=A0AAD4CBF1_ASPNN|nr:hypothetical protein FE257_003536 [Aspergillus nanangensis]